MIQPTFRLVLVTLSACLMAATSIAQNAALEAALPDYPRVQVETNKGSFTLELFTARAPLTVKNFLEYVNSGFYEGTIFHRVIPGFVIQGGGYDTDYKTKPTRASVPNEAGNGLSNRREFVAMARTSDPHSADSQFYINIGDNSALDPRPTRWGYTVFGRVVEGMDNVDQIGYVKTGAGPVPELTQDVPQEAIVITRMTVVASEDNPPAE